MSRWLEIDEGTFEVVQGSRVGAVLVRKAGAGKHIENWVLYPGYTSPSLSGSSPQDPMQVKAIVPSDLAAGLAGYGANDTVPESVFISAMTSLAASLGQTFRHIKTTAIDQDDLS